MTWAEESESEILTIKLSGEIDLAAFTQTTAVAPDKVCLKVPVILLDFTEVNSIDSSGLATLVEYYKSARSYAGRMAVAGLNNRVRSIFDLVRLGEIFGRFHDVGRGEERALER